MSDTPSTSSSCSDSSDDEWGTVNLAGNGPSAPLGACSSSCSDDSDDEWGTVDLTGNGPLVPKKRSTSSANSDDESSDDEWGTINMPNGPLGALKSHSLGSDMFIPEPIICLNATREMPRLQILPADQLPPGSQVWVADQIDVEIILTKHWNPYYEKVSNGRLLGTVIRHSNDMTLVAFEEEAEDVAFSLTLPRSCLCISSAIRDPLEKRVDETALLVKSTSYLRLGDVQPTFHKLNDSPSYIHQMFYEALSVSTINTKECPVLEVAYKNFRAGEFSKVLLALNSLLEAGVYPPRLVDVYLLRSRVFVFQNKYREAFSDAQRCIELEPHGVRGYLSTARALSGLGDFDKAQEMISKALVIVPHSAELEKIMELNSFLSDQQKVLNDKKLMVSMDHLYRRRIRTLEQIDEGEVILLETMPTIVTSSLFASWPVDRCKKCLKVRDVHAGHSNASEDDETGSTQSLTVNMSFVSAPFLSSSGGYCSEECSQLAKRDNSLREKYRAYIQRGRSKLKSIASLLMDSRHLEIANLTTRIFFIVIQHHKVLLEKYEETVKTLSRQYRFGEGWEEIDLSPPSVDEALRESGFYPLVSGQLGSQVKEVVIQLYETLVEPMTPVEQRYYSSELFISLFRYAHAYYRTLKLCVEDCNHVDDSFFFIPRFVGCLCTRSEIEWMARVEIDAGNWSADNQMEFAAKTAANCHVELVDMQSINSVAREQLLCIGPSCSFEFEGLALALLAKKTIPKESLLIPV